MHKVKHQQDIITQTEQQRKLLLVGQLAVSCCAPQLTLLPRVDLNLTGTSNTGGDRNAKILPLVLAGRDGAVLK